MQNICNNNPSEYTADYHLAQFRESKYAKKNRNGRVVQLDRKRL
jgi:hypothetical protein